MAVHPPLRVLFSAVNQARYHDLLRLRLDRVLMLHPLQRVAHLVRRGVRFQQLRHGLFDLLARRPVDLREMLVQLDAQDKPVVLHRAVLFEEGFGADRDMVASTLKDAQIMARKYFYPLTSTFPCYGGRFDPAQTPVAWQASRQVLCLPMYGELPLEDVKRICEIVLGCRR